MQVPQYGESGGGGGAGKEALLFHGMEQPPWESQGVPGSDGALSIFKKVGPLWSHANSCPQTLLPQESGGGGA